MLLGSIVGYDSSYTSPPLIVLAVISGASKAPSGRHANVGNPTRNY